DGPAGSTTASRCFGNTRQAPRGDLVVARIGPAAALEAYWPAPIIFFGSHRRGVWANVCRREFPIQNKLHSELCRTEFWCPWSYVFVPICVIKFESYIPAADVFLLSSMWNPPSGRQHCHGYGFQLAFWPPPNLIAAQAMSDGNFDACCPCGSNCDIAETLGKMYRIMFSVFSPPTADWAEYETRLVYFLPSGPCSLPQSGGAIS